MTGIVDTTRSGPNTVRPYPPLLLRRALARVIDFVLVFALSCLILLPFALSQVSDALLAGGFDSFGDLLREWDFGEVAGGSVATALDHLRPVLLGTVYLQGLIFWAYDWLSHLLTGTTLGKAITKVRVTRHRGSEPTLVPGPKPLEPFLKRAARLGVRAALVVGPPTLAAASLLAATMALPGAADAAEVFIALSLVMVIAWLVGGVGLHGLVTGTRVVGFNWQELRAEAEQHIEYHTGHADEYLHKLQEAARTPSVRQATSTLERDPRVRSATAQATSATAQARGVAQQAEQHDLRSMVENLRTGDDAKAAARHLGELYRKDGLRGVIESFSRPPAGPGGA